MPANKQPNNKTAQNARRESSPEPDRLRNELVMLSHERFHNIERMTEILLRLSQLMSDKDFLLFVKYQSIGREILAACLITGAPILNDRVISEFIENVSNPWMFSVLSLEQSEKVISALSQANKLTPDNLTKITRSLGSTIRSINDLARIFALPKLTPEDRTAIFTAVTSEQTAFQTMQLTASGCLTLLSASASRLTPELLSSLVTTILDHQQFLDGTNGAQLLTALSATDTFNDHKTEIISAIINGTTDFSQLTALFQLPTTVLTSEDRAKILETVTKPEVLTVLLTDHSGPKSSVNTDDKGLNAFLQLPLEKLDANSKATLNDAVATLKQKLTAEDRPAVTAAATTTPAAANQQPTHSGVTGWVHSRLAIFSLNRSSHSTAPEHNDTIPLNPRGPQR